MEKGYWSQWNGKRLNRRRLLAGGSAGAVGVAALAIAGCGSSNKSSSPTAAGGSSSPGGSASPGAGDLGYPKSGFDKLSIEQMRSIYAGSKLKDLPGQKKGPTPGGTLRFASQTPVTWDPTGPAAGLLASYMWANNGLIQYKVNDWVKNPNFMEYEAVLAESMPEQPDDMTYIFHLRQGVKFQNVPPVNGREFTADDVVYCMNLYKTAPAQAPDFQDVKSVEKVDTYTVKVNMNQPAAYWLTDFATPDWWIFSKEQKESSDGLAKKPIGTGGFLFQSSQNLGGYKFVKNPDYFRKDPRTNMQLPYFDAIETTFYPSTAQSMAAYRSKQIDSYYPQDFDSWVQVMDTDPDSITQVTTPAPSFQPYIALRLDKPPFTDPRVRRALSLLVDREATIASLQKGMAGYGYGQDWTYFGNEWPWTVDELGQWMKHDPAQAKQLLDAAGVKDITLDFLLTQYAGFNYNWWIAVAAMWQAAGIKTTISAPQDPATWQKQFYTANYNQMAGTGLIGPGADPDTFAYQTMYSKSPKNYYRINDPKIDDLVQKQRTIMDKTQRQAVLKELMTYDLDQMTRIWGITPYKLSIRRPNMFSLTDVEAAWNPVGWGSCGLDTAWRLA